MSATSRRRAALAVFILVAFFSAFAVPELLARREALPHTATGVATPEKKRRAVEWLLVIGRRAERMAEDDPTPHRNSRIALYHREGDAFMKQTRDFEIRSMTTNERLPLYSEFSDFGNPLTSGYVSVPFGFFSLKKGPYLYPGEIGFLLSDYDRSDGVIVLKQPQVLESVTLSLENNVSQTTEVVRSSYDKTGAWIHATRTLTWSYRDSDGCMNLYKPVGRDGLIKDAPPGPYEWDLLLDELRARKIFEEPPMLAVMPWDDVASGEVLSATLPLARLRLPPALQ